MDFFVWQRTVVDEAGNVLPSASVSVTDVVSGALVQLYSDEGVTGIGNPITADGNGFVQFYVKSGFYDIAAALGGDSRTWNDEAIGSPHKITSAELAASVEPVDYRHPPYSLLRHYSGSGSATSAFNDLIAACTAAANYTATIQQGVYTFSTAPDPVTQGVMLVAPGSQGSNDAYGTVFIFDYDTDNGLEWNGNGAVAAGTGGGIENVLLQVANGRTMGDMIKLIATDDDHRPGEFVLRNVLVQKTGTGLMARALHVDGTAAATAGTKGVRSIRLDKFRCSGCTEDDEYILLNQVVHVFGDHVQIDEAGGSGAPGMTISGDWENIFFSSIESNGSVIVGGTGGHMVLMGHISTLDVNASNTVTGAFVGSASTITSASSDFKLVSNAATSFRARLSADATNVTGDSTAYTVIFDDEDFDRGGNYNPATGVFTCTQGGLTLLGARITIANLTSAATLIKLSIIRKNSGGTELERAVTLVNAVISATGNGYYTVQATDNFLMNEGDTAEVVLQISNTTLTIDIEGSDLATSFWGKLLS